MRRLAALVALLSGLLLVVASLAYSMFDRTEKAERILDRFEFLTLGDNPERYLTEAEITRDGSTELVGTAIPALAREAEIAEPELGERYRALAAAQAEVPAAREFSVRYSEQLDAVDEEFQAVYDIPVPWLPLTATAWMFLLAGLASVLAGVAALRTRGRAPIVAILALGAAIAVGPVALGGVGRAGDGEDVKDFAERGLTDRAATAAGAASASLDDLVVETEERTLPDIAASSGVSEQALDRELEERFPDAARFLEEWDVIGPRLARLADGVSASVDEFESAKKLPIALSVWLLVGVGVAMALAAGFALLRERPNEELLIPPHQR
jgi:hypothetical protein